MVSVLEALTLYAFLLNRVQGCCCEAYKVHCGIKLLAPAQRGFPLHVFMK